MQLVMKKLGKNILLVQADILQATEKITSRT